MADANTAVYAVVDKSKKRKKEAMAPNSFDSPVYDMAETDLSVHDNGDKVDSQYSLIASENMHSTLGQDTPPNAAARRNKVVEKSSEKRSSWSKGTTCKIFTCTLITITIVALILLICIAVLFAEVAKLKQTASTQQSTLASDASFMFLDTRLTMSIQQLNSSIEMLKLSQSANSVIEMELLRLSQGISSLETKTNLLLVNIGQSEALPVTSCAALLALFPSSPSGDYWVRASNGSAVRVYCDMTRSCGGVTGGWVRVAELESSQGCPSGFTQRIDATIRTCITNQLQGTCSSINFPSAALEYTKVCGKIIAFQRGSPDTFSRASPANTINDNYLDGVSVTHGDPRRHIWSFAAGLDETGSNPQVNCPCTNNFTGTSLPPAFVGDDYFCDTGSRDRVLESRFYGDDPLWDGAGCGPLNTCCSFNTPPWFYKELPQPTTDDIEMRVCRNQPRSDEDVQIQTIEIFVQ